MPYEQYLKRFPAYLQQLTMESNGKHVTLDGQRRRLSDRRRLLGRARAPTGSTASTSSSIRAPKLIPLDLIGFGKTLNPLGEHHDMLMSNVFAQAEALAFGKTEAEVRAEGTPPQIAPHRVMEGNRPTNVILAEKLTPRTLGMLVALYEHSVFTQGTIWGHRLVRSVGRGARQGAGQADRAGADERRRAGARARLVDERADSSLSEPQAVGEGRGGGR